MHQEDSFLMLALLVLHDSLLFGTIIVSVGVVLILLVDLKGMPRDSKP